MVLCKIDNVNLMSEPSHSEAYGMPGYGHKIYLLSQEP